MLVLAIRTDKPEAEIGLFDDHTQLAYETWQAHRELSQTLHQKILELLQGQDKKLGDIGGIVAFKGPGSFTGLRIGLTVANALAYGQGIPAVSASGEDWVKAGISQLSNGNSEPVLLPEYGAPAHITKQRK
jgi:tRNA threonylcarbamoyladenosine biosynthesis protein TsaB